MIEKSIGFHIGALSRGAHKYFQRYMEPLGVHRGMIHILMELAEESPLPQSDLTEKMVTDKANTARLLNGMEEAGLVVRYTDPEDRRGKIVKLTDEGGNLVKPVENIILRWVDILTDGMSRSERACYLSLLNRSLENMQEYFGAIEID